MYYNISTLLRLDFSYFTHMHAWPDLFLLPTALNVFLKSASAGSKRPKKGLDNS